MPDKNDTFIGIEIGGTKLQLVTGDSFGNIQERLRYSVNAMDGAAGIREQITEGLKKLIFVNDVAAIGVGFGGPVDWKSGLVQVSHQVEGWADFNIKTWLRQMIGKPVWIDNDANTAALAEATHGEGKGFDKVFYMTIGSGIGGGMIINREVYHGRSPGEVEIGHVRLDKIGNTLESTCSGWALNKKIRDHIQLYSCCKLAELAANSSQPEAYLLVPALKENDADACNIVKELADDIAFALSHVVHLFNPDVIVIGGGLSLLQEYLLVPVAKLLPAYIMKAFLPAPLVRIAALGEDVVPIGALELAKAAFADGSESGV